MTLSGATGDHQHCRGVDVTWRKVIRRKPLPLVPHARLRGELKFIASCSSSILRFAIYGIAVLGTLPGGTLLADIDFEYILHQLFHMLQPTSEVMWQPYFVLKLRWYKSFVCKVNANSDRFKGICFDDWLGFYFL